MKLPLYIAKRYLFARKSHNVINVISAISAVGMAIGTAALILILSVYNGFDRIIEDSLSDLDPDLCIVPAAGRSFIPEGEAFDRIFDHPDISSISSVVEDKVFLSYGSQQAIVKAKGVDEIYEEESALRSHVLEGEFTLRHGDIPKAAVGYGVAANMGIHPRFVEKMVLYYPRRGAGVSIANPTASLSSVRVSPGCIFSISSDADAELVVLPLETMRQLLGYGSEVTSVELRTAPGRTKAVKKEISALLGDGFKVLDRYESHPSLYKMMRYEKAAIFIILLFVVLIVALNIFGSLSMLIIEKEEDTATLRAMGADDRLIRRIFVLEGWLTSLIGLVVGLLAGLGLAMLQQKLGIIKMPGSFALDAYPVIVSGADILLTAASVALVGLLISLAALKNLER